MDKERTQQAPQQRARRKRYSKPACQSEKIFETTALACGKILGQGGACNAVPKAS